MLMKYCRIIYSKKTVNFEANVEYYFERNVIKIYSCYIKLSLILICRLICYFLIKPYICFIRQFICQSHEYCIQICTLPPVILQCFSTIKNAFKGLFLYATLVQHKLFVKCIQNLLSLNLYSCFILNIEARVVTIDLTEYLIFSDILYIYDILT